MTIKIYSPDRQVSEVFPGGSIRVQKPIGFPHQDSVVRRVGPLFYWSWAHTEKEGGIGVHPARRVRDHVVRPERKARSRRYARNLERRGPRRRAGHADRLRRLPPGEVFRPGRGGFPDLAGASFERSAEASADLRRLSARGFSVGVARAGRKREDDSRRGIPDQAGDRCEDVGHYVGTGQNVPRMNWPRVILGRRSRSEATARGSRQPAKANRLLSAPGLQRHRGACRRQTVHASRGSGTGAPCGRDRSAGQGRLPALPQIIQCRLYAYSLEKEAVPNVMLNDGTEASFLSKT